MKCRNVNIYGSIKLFLSFNNFFDTKFVDYSKNKETAVCMKCRNKGVKKETVRNTCE